MNLFSLNAGSKPEIVRNLNQDNITQMVIASFARSADPRLKEIMTRLVEHLHAFAREVRLTEAEWFNGIQFLTGCGCHLRRQATRVHPAVERPGPVRVDGGDEQRGDPGAAR